MCIGYFKMKHSHKSVDLTRPPTVCGDTFMNHNKYTQKTQDNETTSRIESNRTESSTDTC